MIDIDSLSPCYVELLERELLRVQESGEWMRYAECDRELEAVQLVIETEARRLVDSVKDLPNDRRVSCKEHQPVSASESEQ